MSDEELRALERRWRESPEDELAWLRALVREGRRDDLQRHVAALLAGTDLRVVLGEASPADAAALDASPVGPPHGGGGLRTAPRVADAAVTAAAERLARGLGRGRWSGWAEGSARAALENLLALPLERPAPQAAASVVRALVALVGEGASTWEARDLDVRTMWDEYGKTPHTADPAVLARWSDTVHAGCVLLVRGGAFAALAVDEMTAWEARVPERRRLRGFAR